jgi:4-methyl-5(b-hydroxyethyl)-thiazole monophosphate biosynthesis
MTQRALIILHPGFEEIEAVTPIDLLARTKVKVVQAAIGELLLVPGRNGMTLQATHHLQDVVADDFALSIVTHLSDKQTAQMIAESICWPHGL